jgi:hypothetical protein
LLSPIFFMSQIYIFVYVYLQNIKYHHRSFLILHLVVPWDLNIFYPSFQSDYLRKISLKMLTMETKSQNPIGNPLPSNSAGNMSPDPGKNIKELCA